MPERIEIPDTELAVKYFNEVIAPTLGDLPEDGVNYLRGQYQKSALKNDKAMFAIRAWAEDE